MKLCKDCAHFRPYLDEGCFVRYEPQHALEVLSMCAIEWNTHPVSGRGITVTAENARIASDKCGPEGKRWEPKAS